MFKRIKGKLILLGVSGAATLSTPLSAQINDLGLSKASNTTRAFQDAPINRASGLYRPLDLLNDFYPSIEVRIEDRDNVRRRPDFEESDLLTIVSPSLGYRTNFGRHQFYAAYNGTFTFHQDIDQEDAESNVVSANLGLDLTRRWDLDVFGSFGESFEERGISGSREFVDFVNNGIDSGPETVNFVSYGADLIFGRKLGVIQAVLGYEVQKSRFDSDDLLDTINFSDGRDRTSETLHFDVDWRFSDRASLFARIEQTDTDFDNFDTTLDSDQTDFLLGLRWRADGSLSGVVGVGVSDRDFDDPSRENFDSSIYYANLTYSFNPFSTISLNASRTFEEPSDITSDFFESELFGVSWNHALNTRTSLSLYAQAIDDDFNTNREDQFFDWGVELSYGWRNWLTASIYYSEVERDSNIDNVEFDDTIIGIRLRSDLRSLLGSSRKRKDKLEPSSFGRAKRSRSINSQ